MRKFLAGNSNCAVALAVVLLAALTGSSSPNVGLSDASGSHASAVLAGPTKPACGSNELVIYQRSLSSGQPRCEAASRPAASPDYSSVDVGFSDAPDSDPSAAAAPPTMATVPMSSCLISPTRRPVASRPLKPLRTHPRVWATLCLHRQTSSFWMHRDPTLRPLQWLLRQHATPMNSRFTTQICRPLASQPVALLPKQQRSLKPALT
jgi:hypothetical protein